MHAGTVCAVAALLVAAGWRLPGPVLALAAAVTAAAYWWNVYTWPRPHSVQFHRVAELLLAAIPLTAFAACGAANVLRQRLARIAAVPGVVVEQA